MMARGLMYVCIFKLDEMSSHEWKEANLPPLKMKMNISTSWNQSIHFPLRHGLPFPFHPRPIPKIATIQTPIQTPPHHKTFPQPSHKQTTPPSPPPSPQPQPRQQPPSPVQISQNIFTHPIFHLPSSIPFPFLQTLYLSLPSLPNTPSHLLQRLT